MIAKIHKSGRADIFGCCIGDNIVDALVLGKDLELLIGPADVMVLEFDVSKFGGNKRGLGQQN